MTAKDLRQNNTCVTESGEVYTVKTLFVKGKKYIPYLVRGKRNLKLSQHWRDDLTSLDAGAMDITYVYDSYGNLLWDRYADAPDECADDLEAILNSGNWTEPKKNRRISKADLTISRERRRGGFQAALTFRKDLKMSRVAVLFDGDTVYIRKSENGYAAYQNKKNANKHRYLRVSQPQNVEYGDYDLEYNEAHDVWIGKKVQNECV